MPASELSRALRRDRWAVIGAVLALAALCWAYLIWLSGSMSAMNAAHMADMPGMSVTGASAMAPNITPWTAAHALCMFGMWAVMMVGMMTPSVAPMILIYMQVARRGATSDRPFVPAGWFALGYLSAWTLFAALATAAQWGLESLALLTPMMVGANRFFGGAILLGAGIYQWLPAKDSCLTMCRSPLSFVQRHGGFQHTIRGSLRLGLLHGLYCLGCCWALMAVLFVVGVMNLLWISLLMMLVLLEKLLPWGSALARIAGLVAAASGVLMLVHSP